jgi:hypothetical protein
LPLLIRFKTTKTKVFVDLPHAGFDLCSEVALGDCVESFIAVIRPGPLHFRLLYSPSFTERHLAVQPRGIVIHTAEAFHSTTKCRLTAIAIFVEADLSPSNRRAVMGNHDGRIDDRHS